MSSNNQANSGAAELKESTTTSQQALAPPRLRAPIPLDLPALKAIRGRRVILASASPRRRQLLSQIGLTEIEAISSAFAEDLSKSGTAFDYVLDTATQKALTVYQQEINNAEKGEPALVIAADTVVVSHFGDILEKPMSRKDHIDMLKMLRDSGMHTVYTAVVCITPLETAEYPGYRLKSHVEPTSVKFDPNVTDELIVSYVNTREGVDKAGGYGIQGIGAILVERIEGSYDNVVGLPLRPTLQLIERIMTPVEEDESGDEE